MPTLHINLRTELTGWSIIEVHVIKRLTRKRTQEIYVEFVSRPPGDFRAGARVTEVNDLREDRDYSLVLRLLDRRGASIGMDFSIIRLRDDDLIVTRVIVP